MQKRNVAPNSELTFSPRYSGILMAFSEPASESRQRLKDVRNILLDLHKAVLDSERTAYEITHGPIGPPAAFLQMLIHDQAFAWLRPLTSLVVQIDETLAAKKPPATDQELDRLVDDTSALLSPSRAEDGFWNRYQNALDRDPGVGILHVQMRKQLAGQQTVIDKQEPR